MLLDLNLLNNSPYGLTHASGKVRQKLRNPPFQRLFGQFSGAQYGPGFVQRFGPYNIELEISGDSGCSLGMQLFVLDQSGAADNGQIHVTVATEIADCVSEDATFDPYALFNDFHHLGFWCTKNRADLCWLLGPFFTCRLSA